MKFKRRFLSLSTASCVMILVFVNSLSAQKKIAITFDDLPLTGEQQTIQSAEYVTNHLRAVTEQYNIPVTLFITGQNLFVDGQTDSRVSLIKSWDIPNVDLQNHSFSHLSYHQTQNENFFNDIRFKNFLVKHYFQKDSTDFIYFRAPFNHIGERSTKTDSLLQFLAQENMLLAPFTIENSDYIYNKVYINYYENGEYEKAKSVGKLYLEHLKRSINYFEELSYETFGEYIPQILLIHSNRINADYFAEMILLLQNSGYQINSFQEIVKHSAYQNEHPSSEWGISWIHRWRQKMRLENRLRSEPEVPESIFKKWQEL